MTAGAISGDSAVIEGGRQKIIGDVTKTAITVGD